MLIKYLCIQLFYFQTACSDALQWFSVEQPLIINLRAPNFPTDYVRSIFIGIILTVAGALVRKQNAAVNVALT